jgi:hypothetical protein
MTKIDKHKTVSELREIAFNGNLKSPLRYLRYELENNDKLKELLQNEEVEVEEIIEVLRDIPPEPDLDAALVVFLDEQKKTKESGEAWIIDDHSGLAIAPINESSLFRPIHINEDGSKSYGAPILHPGISSRIAIRRQELEQKNKILEKLKPSTVEHIVRPKSILEVASEELSISGIECSVIDSNIEIMEIGRENFDGLFQAPNEAFHRFVLYGKLLARRILSRDATAFEFNKIEERSNSKSRWYDVHVRLKVPQGLSDQNHIVAEPEQKP